MKLKSNYALIGFKQEIRNLLMASYVVTLALGHTLKCMSIKADTMIRYLNAAEELSIPKKHYQPIPKLHGKTIPLHRGNHQRIQKMG